MSMHFSFGGMSMSFSMQSSSHLDPQEHHHMPATPHIPYGASAQERLSTGRSALAALMSPPVPEKEILQIEDRPQPKATAAKPVSVRPLKVEEID
jgi:hypothetical protein